MNPRILANIGGETLSLIFNFIIVDLQNFHLFAKLLISWATRPNASKVKDILEDLNWDALFKFHNHEVQVTRDAFHGFIMFAVRYDVEQALFYDSVRNLFLMNDVEHHLATLSGLSGNHLPALFSYIFFKSVYRPFHIEDISRQMNVLLNSSQFRGKVVEHMNLLGEIYSSITERDYLLPVNKFCPNARNTEPILQIEGEPFQEELWYSLCPMTVEEDYRSLDEPFGKRLTLQHIWNSDCPYCRLQIIAFKILLGSVYD